MKNKIWFVIKILLIIVSLLFSGYLIKVLKELNVLPNKYFILAIGALVLFNIINICLLLPKKKVLNILGVILSIIIVGGSIFGIKRGNQIVDFFNESFSNNKVELTEYSVLVLKDSNYEKIEDLVDTSMGYSIIDDNEEDIEAVDKIKDKAILKQYENPYSLYEDLKEGTISSFMLSEGLLQILEDEFEDLSEVTKVIHSFGIEKKIESEQQQKVDKLVPVNILISGSDSRSGKIQAKTRSDVNMIMTIDPVNHKILLTSIPRDYYVQLHGKTGLKDKLTHAGIYGIDMSRKTLEDLFEIKIDYSIKVGFNSVIKVVDLIGGVDINSDKAFTCGGKKVVKGMNHFDGKQALCYARERHTYKEGDNHRVQNQQQVLEAIIEKISSDRSILRRYDKLLESFKELYRTDIPSDYIKLIVRDQLDNMSSWTIEKQQVSGTGSMGHCYSMPSWNLWIMIPDMNSVKEARAKIVNITGEVEEF